VTDLGVTVADVDAATAGVLATLADRTDADARAASLLPGWTVGHVLTHVARNADAFVRVAADRRAGRTGTMYPDGAAGRNADIEAGSTRSMADLLADVAEASARFTAAWTDPVPDGPCRSWEGIPEFPAHQIPLRRLREVEVHATDTGLPGATHERWTDAYVQADLPFQWRDVQRRTDKAVDRSGQRDRDVLAWLLDRLQPDGLPTLLPWGAPDQWIR
jgi:maleylpyruvate isomerase